MTAPGRIASSATITECIDTLVACLHALKEQAAQGRIHSHTITSVSRAQDRLDNALLSRVAPSEEQRTPDSDQDPAPDRLRSVLLQAVVACVSNLRNRYVAHELLGEPFDAAVAEEIERLFEGGSIPFHVVRRVLMRGGGPSDGATFARSFASMTVNRDWAVSGRSPVTVGKLPDGISFHALLGSRKS